MAQTSLQAILAVMFNLGYHLDLHLEQLALLPGVFLIELLGVEDTPSGGSPYKRTWKKGA